MKVDNIEVDRRLAQFKTVVREAGIKLTHQRLEIFRAVASSLDHPSAEAIHRTVKKAMPTVSIDTVYRTLWLLADLGLLNTLGPRQDSVRFDANVDKHHHYVCTRCGLVRDFESDELNALNLPETVEHFGRIVSSHIEVRGICERCAQKPAPTSRKTQTPRGANRSKS